jgi:hypothetical protein
VRVVGLTSMRPVSEVEILQAAAQWVQDKEHHLTRPPGPGTVKVFQQCAFRWFRFHDSLIPSEEVVPVCEDLVVGFRKGEIVRGVSGELFVATAFVCAIFLIGISHISIA